MGKGEELIFTDGENSTKNSWQKARNIYHGYLSRFLQDKLSIDDTIIDFTFFRARNNLWHKLADFYQS